MRLLHEGPIRHADGGDARRAKRRVLEALAFSLGRDSTGVNDAHRIWQALFRDMTVHDSVAARIRTGHDLTFEATISASCFAQLKRHRMMTLLPQPYALEDGVIVPPSVREAGLDAAFAQAVEADASGRAGPDIPSSRRSEPYLLTNAQRRRVLMQMNARELYHFARLRCDRHAQWEIRALAEQMVEQARQVWPEMLALACGKDQFAERYAEYFAA